MGNRRIILELDREPQDLQAVWRLDSIARLIQQALTITVLILLNIRLWAIACTSSNREPVGERLKWWNFVSSHSDRIDRAKQDWQQGHFGQVPEETEFIPLPKETDLQEQPL